jgi:ABC-2 type transport system ATP-binding protein
MDEAQHLADDVAIIVKGEIVAQGSPSELAGRASGRTITATIPADAPPLPEGLASLLSPDGGRVETVTEEPEKVLHLLTGWALENDLQLIDLEARGATLEDVYLELTGQDAEGAPAVESSRRAVEEET